MSAIHVIGLGTGLTPASAQALAALDQADLIIGAERHLQALPPLAAKTCPYPSPFSATLDLIEKHQDKNLVLLASGDALFFGIGGYLRAQLPNQELIFHPNISSMQSAFAHLGMDWQSAQFLSLHGRPLRRLRATLRSQQRLCILTDSTNTPQQIAQTLLDCGYGSSQIHVLEALDSDQQRIGHFSPAQLIKLAADHFNPLNLVILETAGNGGLLPDFPGIDDEQLLADGQGRRMFTKRQVRLNALSLLQSRHGDTGWDIGAGCGGLTLEWARWHPQTQIYAMEMNVIRLDCLRANQQRFGDHGNLHIRQGQAPQALAQLPDPDRIFIGGNAGQLAKILATSWSRLKSGGRMVAVAVTLESRAQLNHFAQHQTVHWEEISVSLANQQVDQLGDQTMLKPQLPVLMMLICKP